MQCPRIINPDDLEMAGLVATFDAWSGAVAASDAHAMAELVAEDAEFWTHERAPLVGRGAVEAAFTSLFDSYEARQDFECDELIVTRDWAFARGTEVNRLTPKEDGGATGTSRQRAFSVLRREQDGRWRFARGMTNSPPAHGSSEGR